MSLDPSLRERFWRDVAAASGYRNDPQAIREAVQDMMRNYRLDEVPGFEAASDGDAPDGPDTSDFSQHSAFAPVFSRSTSNQPSSWGCFNAARPIFVSSRRMLRRRRSSCPEPRQPDPFPDGGNPGIQADTDQLIDPTPPANGGVPPWQYTPQLPPWGPHHYVWAFPSGHLAWSPHPQPTPSVPYPLSPWAAITLTGGHPLPGTMPQWTPGTWPPLEWSQDIPIRLSPHLIPNPNNTHLPLIDWNVTKHPSMTKRLTPNHVVVDMSSIWEHPITDTSASTVLVMCDVGHLSTLWGPIAIDHHGASEVRVRDLFDAVHQYFQVPLTYPEVRYLCALHPSNYRRLADAYHVRCHESAGLPGWEARQGFKRADVLGDRKYWWGMWVTARAGVWWLNLGLMNPAHRVPPRQ